VTDWSQDAFWVALAPAVFSRKRLAAGAREADRIVALLALEPGAAILDLACGVGRHALALARRGFAVTGVDFAADLIERARSEAASLGVEAEWIAADMREFERPSGFDAAVSLSSSFGLLIDDAEIIEVAARVRRSLRAGGAFLLEMVGREVLARSWRDRWWIEDEGVFVLEERTVRPDWKYVDARWIRFEGGARRDYTATQRVFSGDELRALLVKAGFESVELFGSLRGAAYDERARRLVAVARPH